MSDSTFLCSADSRTTALAIRGFTLVHGLLAPAECDALIIAQASAVEEVQPAMRIASSGGSRNLLAYPWCAAVARRLQRHTSLASLLPPNAVVFQCTYFEKTLARNWLVPWHQDLSIPVANHVEAPGLRGWSEKEGTMFVQPPAHVLQELVAVRLHLDPCHEKDGALRVAPGTHRRGILSPEQVHMRKKEAGEVVCSADAGDALVMRPLLLHASSRAAGDSRRRVLHFMFGPAELPLGLRWP